ncbi:hypothetical protein ACOMHN_005461 [Nucella lapillus]
MEETDNGRDRPWKRPTMEETDHGRDRSWIGVLPHPSHSQCALYLDQVDEAPVRIIYQVGFGISTLALLLALAIFLYFRPQGPTDQSVMARQATG